jgi:branched-chain amino acid transport system permease protein
MGSSKPIRRILAALPTVLIVAAAALAIVLTANAQWLKILTSVAVYTLTSAAIALLYRRLGQVTLAHVALMGCGGWVALRLAHGTELPFEAGLLAGGLFTAIVGMLMAYPALRMRGLYLALVTLMAAGGFAILIGVIRFPNGGAGWTGFEVQAVAYMRRPLLAQSDQAYLVYSIAVAALGFLIIHLHEIGRPGRAWALIRKSEASAMAAGVNVTFYKVWGFALSGFLAGIAGGLLAGSLQLLDARSFPAAESVLIFALTIAGGAWHWFGAVIAAALYRLLPALFNDWGINGNAAYIIFGAGLIHALISAPQGIAGQVATGLSGLFAQRGERP